MKKPLILFIDLFCGAGGVSTGADLARLLGEYQPVKLISCVNHDPLAIESHKTNHSQALHFNEDVRSEKVVEQLATYTRFMRDKYPEAIVLLWASMECTNYSKAKGGKPRDADSRSLPEAMLPYITAIDPEYFYFENVVEFLAWGPLDENGKPISMKKGRDYLKWVKNITSLGYGYEKRVLNAADFGAHTKRKRLFGIFSKAGFPIIWANASHTEKPNESDLFNKLKPWNPVKDCLDFTDEGKSIFNRNKPLVEATEKRILAGLNKYVAKGDGVFIQKHFSGRPWGKVYDINQPGHAITTSANQSLVKCAFNYKYYGTGENIESVEAPAGTLRTKDGFGLVQTCFIDKQYSGDENHQSVNDPAGSITTNPKFCLVKATHFITRSFSSGVRNSSIEVPAGAILSVPKLDLIEVKVPWILQSNFKNKGSSINKPSPTLLASRNHHSLALAKGGYLMNPQYQSKGGSINDPSFTLIARMDKAPPSLNQVHFGQEPQKINWETDTPTMRKIKVFCWRYGIVDITTRMLRVPELKKIQGFPEDYYLAGNQSDQKKFIGNSVCPAIVKAMMEALANRLYEETQERVAA